MDEEIRSKRHLFGRIFTTCWHLHFLTGLCREFVEQVRSIRSIFALAIIPQLKSNMGFWPHGVVQHRTLSLLVVLNHFRLLHVLCSPSETTKLTSGC